MTETLSPEIVESLLDDCRQNITSINQELSDAQSTRTEVSMDLVNRMFRSVHIIRGAAVYLKSQPLVRLSQTTEQVLSEIRDHGLVPSIPVVDALLASADRMDEIVRDFDSRSDFHIAGELEKLACVLRAGNVHAAGKLKALVVEDDFSSRVLLEGLLAKYGDCHVALNECEAIIAFASALEANDPYQLLCIDLNMPGIGIKEAVTQIRAVEQSKGRFPGVKILMTTPIPDRRTSDESVNVLCDAYLFKPVNGAELEDHLVSFGLFKPSERGVKTLSHAATLARG